MILLIDTETTGKPDNYNAPISDTDNWPRLVQIAWIKYDFNGNVIEEYDSIIKPLGFRIPNDASLIHRITTEYAIERGEELRIVLNKLKDTLTDVDVVVAHNISFDEKIIGSEFFRLGLENYLASKAKICTMEESTNFCAIPGYRGYKFPKLSELYYKLFNQSSTEMHDAKNDIQITAKCFWELYKRDVIKIEKNKSKWQKNNSIDSNNNKEVSLELEYYEQYLKSKKALGDYLIEHKLTLAFGKKAAALGLLHSNMSKVPPSADFNEELQIISDFHYPKVPIYELKSHQRTFLLRMKVRLVEENNSTSPSLQKYQAIDEKVSALETIGQLSLQFDDKVQRDLLIYIYYYYLDLYKLFLVKPNHQLFYVDVSKYETETKGSSGCLPFIFIIILISSLTIYGLV
ncbi:MAG: 3'-5' exonuclease [Chitinophagaceae bacterium]